ncbi:serine/threonine-protein kinase [Cellulomonas gilvus]|uniref:Serine/threonine protein kinase n=1 Tax=Cellulomonas gilvus (strain ATCC 13127 / NRRL B-14078) TaxID=593907 RepID=F8A3L1_CELGA|nr:hypothetical protein [Cellulomonas gilvus]AEI11914.1 hypothetical protein Celgi_1395 [Cellulomonas gilvus ATCC 13127]
MTTHVPVGAERALAAAGFRADGSVGPGAVLGVALDGSGRRVELHAVRADEGVAERVRILRAVRHDHLPAVLEVVELGSAMLGVFVEHVPGLPLTRLQAARGPLGPGEAVTVAVPVAQALGALHAAGLVHGEVDAAAVVLDAEGRPVLTGVAAILRGRGTAPADVRALIALVVHALADEPTGATDVVGGLREALTDLLTLPDTGRAALTADRVVDRCFRSTAPRPVVLPGPAELAAAERGPVGALRSSRAGRRSAGARGTARPWVLAGAGAVCAVVLVAVAVLALGADEPGRAAATEPTARAHGGPASTAPSGAVPTEAPTPQPARTAGPAADAPRALPDDPAQAAAELTRRRVHVLQQGDAATLGDVEVPAGPAHVADTRVLAELAGARLDGLTVRVHEALVLSHDDERARVRVTSTTSAYTRVQPDGRALPGGPRARESVVLELRRTPQGWRVWAVSAA